MNADATALRELVRDIWRTVTLPPELATRAWKLADIRSMPVFPSSPNVAAANTNGGPPCGS